MRRSVTTLCLLLPLACGGAKKNAEEPEPEGKAEGTKEGATADTEGGEAKPTEAEAQQQGIPTECASSGEICTPPKAFVDRLCQDVYPNVALTMFRQGTPWTRGYLTRKTEAWNASGGASVAGFLEFDEEVILLKHRAAPKGGMQVSGAGGGYEALRWNGACVTLSGEEITLRPPPAAKHPPVEWKWLDEGMREALRNDSEVNEAYQTQRKECKGVTIGTVSDKCVKAVDKLSKLIVGFVRKGGELPKPEQVP
jgi:hypothetical protein